MMTTAPPGHVHEDFSTVIDEVKPAPVDKRKLSTTPLYRQQKPPRLLASVALSHCLILSRFKHDSGGHTLSLSAHFWSQIQPDPIRRGR